MAAFDDQLIHSVTIRRATQGAEDDYGQPALTWADLATVQALIQPRNTRLGGGQAEELTTHGGGTSITDHNIFLRPTDITSADEVYATDAGTYTGKTFEVILVRDAGGQGHHLEVSVRLIEPEA